MKTTNILLTIPFLLLTAVGCTSDEQVGEPVTNEKGEYPVNFSGSMDMTLTKAADDVKVGVKAQIMAYTKGVSDFSSNNAIVSHGYTVTGTAGTFVGDQVGDAAFVMYLPKGEYDFYAASTNSSSTAPSFISGQSGELENGVDYIWKKVDKTVGNSDETVELTFEHKAVHIVINLESGDGLSLIDWQNSGDTDADATISLPTKTNCKMSLSDGTIVQATGVEASKVGNMTTTSVSSGKSSASYIMLPLATSNSLTVKFKVKVNIGGRTEGGEEKEYTATITAPTTDGFVSGKQYTYKAKLKANAITFSGAKVAAWSDAGQQSDLTPTEPETT